MASGTKRKAALITGGARRIGAAIARDLAGHGFSVAIHCHRSTGEAEALAGEIAERGGRAAIVTGDLRQPDALEPLLADAETAIGPLGLLVNNASVFRNDTAVSPDLDLWDEHFAIHARAPVMLTSLFAAALTAGEEGLVVNIIDQRVWRLTPNYFSYTLSKSALWVATRTMAQALAPRVRVNAIGPGPTLANERQTDADFARQQAAVPLGRGPELTEFGRTIRWLWECPSVTGQMVALDGGQHLAWQTPDVTSITE
jgi:NAD(P)-dependent dehydrogenase (short-subunit alcohol dehydrogenase family)